MRRDVVVIGGGAAGLMCAAVAAGRGRRVVLLEHNGRVGRKIEISGGGRCNFTNLHTTPKNFLSSNPHFAKSALARYTPADFVALVERHRIRYHEKKLGQLFCDGSSREIIRMLLDECEAAGAEVLTDCRVLSVSRRGAEGGSADAGRKTPRAAGSEPGSGANDDEKAGEAGRGFVVETGRGRFECESVVVATGGLSIPKLGATDFGYRLARQFGLKVVGPRPALVPLTLSEKDLAHFRPLSGISIGAVVRAGGAEFAENFLVTHRGLSGPAVLQVSSYWSPGQALSIDLLPQLDARALLEAARDNNTNLTAALATHLPRRFSQVWCELYAPPRQPRAYSRDELRLLAELLHSWTVEPTGTEGFQKAEVTAGGVDTDELSSKTLEARRARGLFFVGEVVDVTGHLGGFNFQWAWASGHAAGLHA
ncbi:MAG TPA: NAD(P)/FAD-dependent oxidoreductase [Pyrinomonadaceae bacterium]|nr:NAD(P)/FAD-dependent oxidoreductase [Pyrinomonadaceae bacterium]